MVKVLNAINFFLQGLGFEDFADFKKSTFGFMMSEKVIISASIIGYLTSFADYVQTAFGVNHKFLGAYAIMIIFEWATGILASRKRNEPHESKKLGRMLLKIGSYSLPIYILNTMAKNIVFPIFFGFEMNPFLWLYYVVLIVIVWQLFVSILENLVTLKIKYADVLLKIINKKFYDNLGIENDKHD